MLDHLIAERLLAEASAAASESRKKRPHYLIGAGLLGAGYSQQTKQPTLTGAEWAALKGPR